MYPGGDRQEPALWPRLVGWTLFATAFGYMEAAVVVYLRHILGVVLGQGYREILAARGLPFLPSGIQTELWRHGLLEVECGREFAILLLLAGAACAGGRSGRERWGLFGYTFAVWDLTYYLYLALLTGFPRTLWDTDIYFLLPRPWYGPVWLPVLIGMPALLLGSVWLLRRSQSPTVPIYKRAVSLLEGYWNE
jgi:hypothetical protein